MAPAPTLRAVFRVPAPPKSNLFFCSPPASSSSSSFSCCCPCNPFNRCNKGNSFHSPYSYYTCRVSLRSLSPRPLLLSSPSNHHRFASPGDSGETSPEEEARAAVAEILREEGVSEEESMEIASNSPSYVRTLVESVRELDEASLWDSWKKKVAGREEEEDGGGGGGGRSLSFKEKVIHMAKEKGDRGILPFLESAGLNPSTSTHVARYLSSETVLDLIHKVKYVKEMLFSGSDQGTFIGKNAHRMLRNLAIFVDDDIQQTLSFFAKMEARRGGLNMLDSKDSSFPYLIESFPRLLLLSIESHLRPLVEFFEAVGVPKRHIRNILLIYPPIVFSNIEKDIKPRVTNLRKVGIEDKDIGKMLVKYPWILSTSIQGNYEEILSFFDAIKVPKEHVHRAIRSWPHLLGSSTTKMKSMVVHFGELGIRNKRLGQVIASSPQLLLRKPHEFQEVVLLMVELGFEEESIGKILGRCPEIFAASVEKTLKNKLQLLRDFGISEEQLPRVIRKYPELLVSDVKTTLLPRMSYLMKVGLSKREVASMVSRFSPLLGYSIEEVLKPKLEFLVYTMHKHIRDVVDYPRYFSYSLEKKIKPRFWVLKGRNVECSLKEMLGKNDEDFAADFMGIERMLVPPISRE